MDFLTFPAACALVFTALSAPGPAWQQTCPQFGPIATPDHSGENRESWSGYISEASARFAIPEALIRAVMRVESGGVLPATSPAGAMGLMQLMPETYTDLRRRYDLGSDPYEPRDNILAGAAYLREMHDRFGDSGFLAAYNAGPQRFDDYLLHTRPLPSETRRYLAQLAPQVAAATSRDPVSASGPQTAPQSAHPATPQPTETHRRESADTASRYDGGPLFFSLKKPVTAPPDHR